MSRTPARYAAWALIVGSVIAIAGYLSAFLANGHGDSRFTGSSWTPLYTVALLGTVVVIAGLPVLIHVHGQQARTLTLIGYLGVLVPLVVLNIGEGSVEGFVKPYLAKHGGIPHSDLAGLDAYEAPALIVLLVGMVCLGIAVFRAGVLPRWVGAAFIITPILGVAGLPGGAALLPDYLLFTTLSAVAVHVLRAEGSEPLARAALRHPATT